MIQQRAGQRDEIQRAGDLTTDLKKPQSQAIAAAVGVLIGISPIDQRAHKAMHRTDMQIAGGSQISQQHTAGGSGQDLDNIKSSVDRLHRRNRSQTITHFTISYILSKNSIKDWK